MRLKTIREAQGLSQKELADKVGLTDKAISAYEREKRMPNLRVVKKIAKVLDCKVDDLLKDDDDEEVM